jgi:hypothetical protein
MRYTALAALVALQTLLATEPVDTKSETTAAWRVIDDSIRDGSSEEHREQALAALSTFGDSNAEAIKRAVAALHDKDAVIRRSAAIALGELKAHSALADLKQSLTDTPEVSFAAAKALTRLGDTSGRDVMIAVLAGERKDAPGMVTNAMRDAKDRLHHPEGLFLMGTEDAAGSMFGPASIVIPGVKDTTDLRSKGAPGKAAAVAIWQSIPIRTPWNCWRGRSTMAISSFGSKRPKRWGTAAMPGVFKLDKLLDDQHNIVRDMAAVSILRILDRDGEAGAVAPGPVQQPKTDKKSP